MANERRQQIDYAKKALRRKYTGADLAAGPLEAGKYYRLTVLGAGDDFLNVQSVVGAANIQGLVFKATGTTPTVWANGSILNEMKLADLRSDADLCFASASKTVTITSGGADGASQAGQITFPKDVLGTAFEELIEFEFDPNFVPPPLVASGSVIHFGL